MKKNFLLCLVFSLVTFIWTSCGTDKKETVQEGQNEALEHDEEESSAVAFEKHEVMAYPDAIIEMYSPLGNENFDVGRVPFEFNIKNYPLDRKSTRLNSSHVRISYAVFCLKKKIQGMFVCQS